MIKTHGVYYPLYNDREKFIYLITGGRSSGKSFMAGTFIERLTFEVGKNDIGKQIAHQILYTRYTMVSAGISVIPEFWDKVEADGTERYFHRTKTDVINKMTGSHVMFRGIKTSSGNQTAKLKSIHGITTLVVDEAEEWVSETEFDTIMLSIRQKGLQNRIIIIMNPTDSNHFIYQRYIRDTHRIEYFDGVPVQISTHPNVLHIHTSYLDNIEHCGEQFLKEVTKMKEENPDKYAHVVMGQWSDVAEGAVFKKWGVVKEFPEYAKKVAMGCDFGYTNDVTAMVKCGIVDNRLYLQEMCYEKGMLTGDIIRKMNSIGLRVIAESAEPRLVDEIALGGVMIYPVQKYAGSVVAGLEKMKDMEIYVVEGSYNLEAELRNYTWAKDNFGNYINEPIDAWNHCFVGDTLITTERGLVPIKDVKVGDKVLNSDGWHKVTKVFDNGLKQVCDYSVVTDKGAVSVSCTENHNVKINGGWKHISELQAGDRVYVCSGIEAELESLLSSNPREERVYDLEVDGVHEYYANGLLVHNCIDSARYYVLGELLGKVMKPRNVTKDMLGIY